jgi:hypothetical protein
MMQRGARFTDPRLLTAAYAESKLDLTYYRSFNALILLIGEDVSQNLAAP